MSVVVSARVPKWVKEVLERHGMRVSELVRRLLIEEAKRLSEEELRKALDDVASMLEGKIDPQEWAEIIDENRKLR